ncbi:MAG TPA: C13 family peptidase [Steroidobacteraceae bacterium]|nr:C13 family peptidase [Steroidobacteraceae bacterium]
MEPITFSTELTVEDWQALQFAARQRPFKSGTRRSRLLSRLPALGAALLWVGVALALPGNDSRVAWVAGVFVGILTIVLVTRLTLRGFRPQPGGSFLGPVRFSIDSAGVHSTRPHAEGVVRWPQILTIDATATHVFVWIDMMTGYVIPGRSLPAPFTTDTLAAHMRALKAATPADVAVAGEAAQGLATDAAAPGARLPAPAPRAQPTVWQEIVSVARLVALRALHPARFVGRDPSIFVLAAILLALWTVLDPLTSSDALEITWYSLPGLAWVAVGVMGLAWVLSRVSRPRIPYRQGLLLATGALAIAICIAVVARVVDDSWFYLVIAWAILWGTAYLLRGLGALTGLPQWRAIFVAALGIFGFAMLSDALYVNPSIWYYADDDSNDDESYVDAHTWQRMEELQFTQQSRLDTALAPMAALPHTSPASWFVGFAGYGEQHVFADEIALAAREFAARYDAYDRNIILANDRRDPAQLPLASAPALRYTLRRIGAMMRPDDVLFLALSSHGSEDGSISISNEGRSPADLSAIDLAAMLREAKIPWKVVVVSACYSGAFIDALRDDRTIVLTAAAADRTSFGCGDDRDLTYFGEAFYQDAIPGAPTLRAAFEQARQEIATWEKKEQYPASDPQAFFGVAMEQKLAGMEK